MATAGRKLTKEQERKIVADYVLFESYGAAAKENGVDPATARRVCQRRPDLLEAALKKKQEQQQSVEDFMDSQRDKVFTIIRTYLDALMDPYAFEKLTPVQLSTVIGTLLDKWTGIRRAESSGQSQGVVLLPEVREDE